MAKLNDLRIEFDQYNPESPFLVLELASEEDAKRLVARALLVRAVYELWGTGADLDSLHRNVQEFSSHLWSSYLHTSFRFDIQSFNGHRSNKQRVKIIESFSYLGFEGKIEMRHPQASFVVFEDYHHEASEPRMNYFGRYVGSGNRRSIAHYDLKKRHYIGTTSMDAELSLITANIAGVARDHLVLDPFVGTGSFLVAAAVLGAACLGSDIDGRQIRGKSERSIRSNFQQYGLGQYLIDCFASDLANHVFRNAEFLDAIICDRTLFVKEILNVAPYGVREGLKVLGTRQIDKAGIIGYREDGTESHL